MASCDCGTEPTILVMDEVVLEDRILDWLLGLGSVVLRHVPIVSGTDMAGSEELVPPMVIECGLPVD